VTSRAVSPGYDFISRFFAPAAGVNEDPVTGSAHCTLGPSGAGTSERGISSPTRLPSAAELSASG